MAQDGIQKSITFCCLDFYGVLGSLFNSYEVCLKAGKLRSLNIYVLANDSFY